MLWFWNKNKKPVLSGWLPAVDGHEIYYHTYGNPKGETVLLFHGGPGGSSKIRHTSNYNLKKYYIILFDQRGCGKSKFEDLLYKNTPLDAVNDAKRLLEHLNISGKVVSNGGSYGSLLAILFAEKYPELVSNVWLGSIFLGRDHDVQQWEERDAARFYPDFISELKRKAGNQGISDYFAKELFSGDKNRERDAMKYYGSLEGIVGSKTPEFRLPETEEDYEKELKSLKIYTHMVINHFFMSDNYLIKNSGTIKNIPTEIFHNRLDLCCPFEQAWELHNALPKSNLHIVPALGHGGPEMNKMLKEFYNSRQRND